MINDLSNKKRGVNSLFLSGLCVRCTAIAGAEHFGHREGYVVVEMINRRTHGLGFCLYIEPSDDLGRNGR